jgi:ribonucleoside-diphosphate reductase alpha chain
MSVKRVKKRKNSQMNNDVSNLSVAPETKILTDQGYKIISELKDQKVNIWNGKEFIKTTIKKSDEKQKLLKITFSNGAILECTEYVNFVIRKKRNTQKEIIETKDLKKGMKLVRSNFPVIDGKYDIKYPYTSGLFTADGNYYIKQSTLHQRCVYPQINGTSFCGRHSTLDVYKDQEDIVVKEDNSGKCLAINGLKKSMIHLCVNKRKLLDYLDIRPGFIPIENIKKSEIIVLLPLDIPKKFTVPLNGSLKNKLDWFTGYCDGDGYISTTGRTNKNLQITSVNLSFLENVRLMCTTLGIDPKISLHRKAQKKRWPDGHGGYKDYDCKAQYRLLVTSNDLFKLVNMGYSPKRLNTSQPKPQYDVRKCVQIISIEDNECLSDTYGFNELQIHTGIFNGILAGNCNESF